MFSTKGQHAEQHPIYGLFKSSASRNQPDRRTIIDEVQQSTDLKSFGDSPKENQYKNKQQSPLASAPKHTQKNPPPYELSKQNEFISTWSKLEQKQKYFILSLSFIVGLLVLIGFILLIVYLAIINNQSINGSCFDTKNCVPTKNLVCLSGKCVCDTSFIWNNTHCVPNSPPSLASNVLTQPEVNQLYSTCGFSNSERFSLLYRANRDGFLGSMFHSKCDGFKNLLVIVHTRDNSVFGGYTSTGWLSSLPSINNYDGSAFLFSVRRHGLANHAKMPVVNPAQAIYYDANQGPIFGTPYDMFISTESNATMTSYACSCRAYSCPFGYNPTTACNFFVWNSNNIGNFQTSEIEVFQKL